MTTDHGLRTTDPGPKGRTVIENPESIRAETSREFRLQADSTEQLLFDWLAELLYIDYTAS